MFKIDQEYHEYNMKYSEMKLVFWESNEKGIKIIDGNNMKSFGSNISSRRENRTAINLLLQERFQLEKELINIDKRLRKGGHTLLIYIKIRTEFIDANTISDNREYNYLRVVVRGDSKNPITYEKHLDNFCYINIIQNINSFLKQEIFYKKFNMSDKINYKNYKLTFAPKAAGVFVHEAIGHMIEEDIFQYVENNLREINFPNSFTLCDDPTGYEKMVGINKIDDFGTPVKAVKLIVNGKIENIISLDNGFARSGKYDELPIPRMRMLCIESPLEVVEDINDLIITSIDYGQVTPGNLRFELNGRGYFRSKTEGFHYLDAIRIKGNIKDSIESLKIIGRDKEVFVADCVKKGQLVRVGMKSPSMSIICESVEGDLYE